MDDYYKSKQKFKRDYNPKTGNFKMEHKQIKEIHLWSNVEHPCVSDWLAAEQAHLNEINRI